MTDAVALLTSLDESVRDEAPIGSETVSIDDAIAAIGRVPAATTGAIDTSMQTDAYDPEALSLYLSAERDRATAAEALAEALANAKESDADSGAIHVDRLPVPDSVEPGATEPLDLDGWSEGDAREPKDDRTQGPALSGDTDATSLWSRAAVSADPAGPAVRDENTFGGDASEDQHPAEGDAAPIDDEEDAARASRAALRRWGVSGDGA